MSPMKILVVDDSQLARYKLKSDLQKQGVVVELASSAKAALERIRQEPPDAVFMDHIMEEMNGFEALEILKSDATTSHIPVVMCSGNEDASFASQAHRKGAFGILPKSSADEKLPSLLKRLETGAGAPSPSLAPAVAPAELAAIARREAERVIEERLRGSLAALLKEQRESLIAEASARVESGLAARVEAVTRRLNAEAALEASQYVDARLDAQAGQLVAEAARRVEEGLAGRLEAQASQLRDRFLQAQSGQAQVTAQRLADELIPQAVRQAIAGERPQLAQMVQQSVDAALARLAAEPDFLRRLTGPIEAVAVAKAEEAARRESEAVALKIATQRTAELAGGLMQTARPGGATMYLLAAGAALIGVISAVVVHMLG